jgi:glycosyltransferase involved in cell wall biosynthesis
MDILVIIPKKYGGCGFYRLYQPHNHLAKNYDVNVTFGSNFMKTPISAYTDEELKKFDLIVWHKTLFDMKDIRRAKELGIPTIADFDDHWVVNREHAMYKQYTKEGQTTKLHKLLMAVDYITCTTDELADEIYNHNQNVEVFPNAIDTNYDGWKVDRIKEDKFVFGYLGGPCHTRDVALLRRVPEATKAHFRLFGYNGTDIYNHYANILSGGGPNENFSLYKGADIFNYPQFYNMMDVSLVPLEDNRFNSMKSELKLLEAGAFSKAVIVSKVKPYTNIIRHGKNCLAAESKADWINYIKTLSLNPNIAKDLGAQLKEDTKRYDISVVNKDRYKFYKDVQQKHNTDSRNESRRMVAV